jgi:integrase
MGEVVQLLPLCEQEWRGVAEILCGIDSAAGLSDAQRARYLVRLRQHFDVLGEPMLVRVPSKPSRIPGVLTDDQIAGVADAIHQALDAYGANSRALQGPRNARLLLRFAELEARLASLDSVD